MNTHANTARALYLELRALGLEVGVEEDPGSPAGYRVVVGGLRSLNLDHADRLVRLARNNEAGLVELIRSKSDRDLESVRQEGSIA